jgi:hypothetical protein
MFAQVLDLHHLFYQAVDTKHRDEAFELVEQAVGAMHIVLVQQRLDAR